MGIRLSALLAGAMLMLALPCTSQELSQLNVAMKAFEAAGDVDSGYAESLSQQLMQAIEQRSDFRIVSGGPTRYYLKGQVVADDKRHFVTLQLFDSRTNRMIWLANWDYRGTTAYQMAADVIAELSAAMNSQDWQ